LGQTSYVNAIQKDFIFFLEAAKNSVICFLHMILYADYFLFTTCEITFSAVLCIPSFSTLQKSMYYNQIRVGLDSLYMLK
jgi:hypothetical protein